MKTSTIHKYLGFDGKHYENQFNDLEELLVIIDEASMVDIELFYHLLKGINNCARIVIVGDCDQLPSIGPGQVLNDLINSNLIKTTKLDIIHRQKEASSIITLAKEINNGVIELDLNTKTNDFSYIKMDPSNFEQAIKDITLKAIDAGYDIYEDIQILIPKYKGSCGIDNTNTFIQSIVESNSISYKYLGATFRINDKVIQLVNHPEKSIMNGDIGKIISIKKNNGEVEEVIVEFDEGKVIYNSEEIKELKLAYAISVHKAQGSEFKLVIIPIFSEYYFMLKKKLIYTAVTRSKDKLIILGDANLIASAIKRIEEPRKTILKELLLNNENSNFVIPDIDDIDLELGEEFIDLE